MKKKLDEEIAEINKEGKSMEAIKDLFRDPAVTRSILVKKPISDGPWIEGLSKEGLTVMHPIPPDGSHEFNDAFPKWTRRQSN